MSVLSISRRALRPTPEHRSRIHTLRGERLRGRELLELPARLIQRVTARVPDGPWLGLGATRRLKELAEGADRVLEFGSGSSTAWLAQLAGQVDSVEPNREWFEKVAKQIGDLGAGNVEITHVPMRGLVDHAAALDPSSYDVVIVDVGDDRDESSGRVAIAEAARHAVRPGGWLVVDNSDRPAYRAIDRLVEGWRSERIAGYSARPLTPTETSFFQKPSP